MNRRAFVLGAGAAASGIAGCTSSEDDGGSDNQPTPAVEQVAVSGEDYSPGTVYNTLTVRYATQTVGKLRDPDGPAFEPDAGNKYVVVHAEVTVESEGDGQIDVYGTAIGLNADGVIYGGQEIFDLSGLSQTVTPGATFDGWKAYEVPEEVTEAKLVGSDVDSWFEYPTEIVFTQDSSLSADQYEARQ